jgi:lysophospholipase L1-like esterase
LHWHRFVALGDSFTEGLDDPYPGGGRYRGWADLVAANLAMDHTCAKLRDPEYSAHISSCSFQYANLAVRGRLLRTILDSQAPQALTMSPDLVSLVGGANDVTRRFSIPHQLLERLDRTVAELRQAGVDVLLICYADIHSHVPFRQFIQRRLHIINGAVRAAAERHSAILVDLETDPHFTNPVMWSEDRLHMSTAGHRRVAAHVLARLGQQYDASWLAPPNPPSQPRVIAEMRAILRWFNEIWTPWLRRRLTGRSSGDAVTPKLPELLELDDEWISGVGHS